MPAPLAAYLQAITTCCWLCRAMAAPYFCLSRHLQISLQWGPILTWATRKKHLTRMPHQPQRSIHRCTIADCRTASQLTSCQLT